MCYFPSSERALSHLRISSVAWVWKHCYSFPSVNLQISRLVIGSLMSWIRFPYRETGKSLDLGKCGSRPAPSAFRFPPLVDVLLQPGRPYFTLMCSGIGFSNIRLKNKISQACEGIWTVSTSQPQPGLFVSAQAFLASQLEKASSLANSGI